MWKSSGNSEIKNEIKKIFKKNPEETKESQNP